MFIITHGEIYNNIYLYATSMRVQVWSKISPTGTGADIDKKDLGPIPEVSPKSLSRQAKYPQILTRL